MKQGKAEGMKQGIKQGKIEIAKKLLSKGLSSYDIAELTGLNIAEIESLK